MAALAPRFAADRAVTAERFALAVADAYGLLPALTPDGPARDFASPEGIPSLPRVQDAAANVTPVLRRRARIPYHRGFPPG